MTKRKAWLCTIIGSLLFWAGTALVIKAVAEKNITSASAFEFNCKGLTDVVLMENGTLTVNGKLYRLSHGYMNKLVFNDGVMIEGEVYGKAIYFDKSTITISGKSYSCRVE